MKFAVVDIETTGLFHQGHDITEIAVMHVENGVAHMVFESLVHTDRLIPQHISSLTGISNSDTNQAPNFEELIPRLLEALEDCVFVAHNVNFDYQFLKAYFARFNVHWKANRLCTMRYSKRVFPGLESYRLGMICGHLGLQNEASHRAYGDAKVTAQLLMKCLEQDRGDILSDLLKKNQRNTILPPGIEAADIDVLPENSGVYYFYNQHDKLLYIGKAKNIKKRVLSHFTSSGSSPKKQLFQRQVSRIDFQSTGSEYMALLLEDSEIKRHWPALNVAQKFGKTTFAVRVYKNRLNELRFGIVKTQSRGDDLAFFSSLTTARDWLQQSLIDWKINPKRGGFYTNQNWESDLESVHNFIEAQRAQLRASFALLVNDSQENLVNFAAVIDGKYRGFGTMPKNESICKKDIVSALSQAPNSLTAQAVLQRMMNDKNVMKYEI